MVSGVRGGCLDNIFVLNALIQQALNKVPGKLFVLFVDFRRAFPSINHALLWHKLLRLGISSKMISILINLYSQALMLIRSGGRLSGGISITEGVLQGEILSPLLFALFLADLESFLLGRGVNKISIRRIIRILLLAFADDIALFASSWEEMQALIDFLMEYCELNHLKINAEKTNVVIFRKGSKRFSKTCFEYGKERIDLAKNYEYLGIQ